MLGNTTIVHDALIFIRTEMRSDLTDPKSGSRPAGSQFVMLAYPEREAFHPHVIISQSGGGGRRADNSTIKYELVFTIDVLSKSTKELDEICDQVLDQMVANWQTFHDEGLHFVELPSGPRLNPMPGDTLIHRKSLDYSFKVFRSL